MLCPLLAWSRYKLDNYRASDQKDKSEFSAVPLNIDIVLPAHNEAATIEATLSSIQASIQFLESISTFHSTANIQIHVGADNCSDTTVRMARTFQRVSVTEFPENGSKWRTLKALCSQSQADWIIFVDAGTRWPVDFLVKVISHITEQRNIMAISPSYKPLNAGLLHQLVWQIEKRVKQLETLCGGPVTVHGATVCYKTGPLKKVLLSLGDTLWLNDDVVIPLMLRSLFPEGIILYPVGEVTDADGRPKGLEYQRRNRLLYGNLQWVSSLWRYCFNLNPVSGILALRRVFRMFWAYWFVFTILGLALAFHAVLPMLAGAGLLLFAFKSARELAGAAIVSLNAPFRMIHFDPQLQGVWK